MAWNGLECLGMEENCSNWVRKGHGCGMYMAWQCYGAERQMEGKGRMEENGRKWARK